MQDFRPLLPSLPAWFFVVTLLQITPTAPAQPPARNDAVPLQDSSPYSYRYFKQTIPLTLDPTRVAVFHENEKARRRLDSLAIQRLGLAGQIIEEGPLPGWSMIDTPLKKQTPSEVESLLKSIQTGKVADYVSPVFVDDLGGPLIITPDILVGFDSSIASRRAQALLHASGAGVITDIDYANMPNVFRVRSLSGNGVAVLAKANELARLPEVIFAEPDLFFTARLAGIPNDPTFGSSWGLHNTGQSGGTPDIDMDAPEAWDITTGDPSVIVLVIDVGVQQDHPDINQVPGIDVTWQDAGGGPFNECDNHGTEVAGCVTGIINNNLGSAGIAPACKIASARAFVSNAPVCDGTLLTFSSFTVESLAWGESIGARVSTTSIVYGATSASIAWKFYLTREGGMVHFAASGNDPLSAILAPANLPSVNAVASVDRNGLLATATTTGEGLAFVAPGVSIFTTDRTGADGAAAGDYLTATGTSFASPFAAGVAALILSDDPLLAPSDVEAIMGDTSLDLGPPGYDTSFGWGLVNAFSGLTGLPPDCNGNGQPDGLEIELGSAYDCNDNAIPDSCDLASLFSVDCNINGIPDECENAEILLTTASGEILEHFGSEVAIDSDVMAVCNPIRGEVEVFRRNAGGEWRREAILRGSGTEESSKQNRASIVLQGDLIAFGLTGITGDPGVVFIFAYDPVTGQWSEQAKLLPDIPEIFPFGYGRDIDLDGDLLIVGSDRSDELDVNSGSALIYRYQPDTNIWELQIKLTPDEDLWNSFGSSVAIENDIALVSMGDRTPVRRGSVYVFRNTPGTSEWVQEAKLISYPRIGEVFTNFGSSVSLRNSVAAIGGSFFSTDNTIHEVHLYSQTGTGWAEQGRLTPPDHPLQTGRLPIAFHENAILIGTPFESDPCAGPTALRAGAAYLYRFNGLNSTKFVRKYCASDGSTDANFGSSVAFNNGVAVIGAPRKGLAGYFAGGVYIYPNADCNDNGISDDCEPFFDCNGNGIPDECDFDCNDNGLPDDCETLTDCNNNSIPDECDYDCNANGLPDNCESFTDCNNNGVPDECDYDCNANGIPDDCDISSGFSNDCDRSLIPDECEWDCNNNRIHDRCDISSGFSTDFNNNFVPDECDIPGDVNGNGSVNVSDLLQILSQWGACPDCPADINGDGTVNVTDLLIVLANWTG